MKRLQKSQIKNQIKLTMTHPRGRNLLLEKYGSEARFTPDFFVITRTSPPDKSNIYLGSKITRNKYRFVVSKLILSGLKPSHSDDVLSVCIDVPISPVTAFPSGENVFTLAQIISTDAKMITLQQGLFTSTAREINLENDDPYCHIWVVNSNNEKLADIDITITLAMQEIVL